MNQMKNKEKVDIPVRKAKKEKINKPRRKTKTSYAKLKKACDIAWSKFIHARDKVCQKCGGSTWLTAHHLIGRANLVLRWDEDNGMLLCMHCHIQQAHRNPLFFAEWLTEFKGAEWVEKLKARSQQLVKWSIQDLEDKIADLKSKTEAIDE